MKTGTIVMLICIFALIVNVANPVLAAANGRPENAGAIDDTENSKDFRRCLLNTIKLTPEAKKFGPRGYQELERALDGALKQTRWMNLNPYQTAVLTGAKIGKFIGYDFVYLFGAVQSCWSSLRR